MTLQEKQHIISNHPVFTGLQKELIDFVAERVQEKNYSSHEIIIRQGDKSDAVYLIYNGLYKVYILNDEGKPIPVKTSEVQDFVGDLGVVDGKPVPATVEALQETNALIISKENFLLVMNTYPSFVRHLLNLWGKKVRIINEQRENSFSLQLKERTLFILKKLAPAFPNNTITLSQEEIAFMVGATRARVNEVLHELEQEKKISLAHHTIQIL